MSACCGRSASGENELEADQLFGSIEQQLFSQALSMAEKRGKSIRLAVVAANDLLGRHPTRRDFTAIQHELLRDDRTGNRTRSKRGRSVKPGKNLAIPSRNSIWKSICPMGTSFTKFSGPHAPNLTANEVNLLHRLWLRFSDAGAPLEMHHHDVVHFALEEVQKEMEEGTRRHRGQSPPPASRGQPEEESPKA